MEIPLDVRPERRRQFYAAVHYLSGRAGSARHDDGIFRWACSAGQPYPHVPEVGKAIIILANGSKPLLIASVALVFFFSL